MNKYLGIIQARLISSRLQYKMMLSLHGDPIIKWVVERSKQSKKLSTLIVAIPDSPNDDLLAKYLKKLNVEVFRGAETDVLKRFYETARKKKAENVIRICADNPLIAGDEIDNLIDFYSKNHCDYAYNHIPDGNKYPDGFGAEIVPFEILEELYKKTYDPRHREHCLLYLKDNRQNYLIKTFDPPNPEIHHPEIRFDVDTFEDYRKLSLYDINIKSTTSEIVNIFKRCRFEIS